MTPVETIARIVLRGTAYLEPDQWERAHARSKAACLKIAEEILAALAAREEPENTIYLGDMDRKCSCGHTRKIHVNGLKDCKASDGCSCVEFAAREDTEPEAEMVWGEGPYEKGEDTERPTVRQHEELQRAYEEALGRANRAEKALREDTERPDHVTTELDDQGRPTRMIVGVRDTEQGPKR